MCWFDYEWFYFVILIFVCEMGLWWCKPIFVNNLVAKIIEYGTTCVAYITF